MNFKAYLKQLTPLALLKLAFQDHLESLGYNKISDTLYIQNNISIELQMNSFEPTIVIHDRSTNTVTSYLFEPNIMYKDSAIIKTERLDDVYFVDDYIDPVNAYTLLKMITDKKEELELE